MKGLTAKQREILKFIEDYIHQHEFSPSYREIMQHFSLSSPGSVYKYIRTLKRKGALISEKQCSRSLALCESALSSGKATEIKLPFIGYVRAGYPIEMFIQSQSLAVPAFLVPHPAQTYILRVQGDSLIEEFIADGDFLLVEARSEAQEGEMIIGLINQQETVIKYYYAEGQYIRLEGRAHQPLILHAEHLAVQGVLIGLFRSY